MRESTNKQGGFSFTILNMLFRRKKMKTILMQEVFKKCSSYLRDSVQKKISNNRSQWNKLSKLERICCKTITWLFTIWSKYPARLIQISISEDASKVDSSPYFLSLWFGSAKSMRAVLLTKQQLFCIDFYYLSSWEIR